MSPKVEIRDGEVWVCLGSAPTNERFAIIREGQYEQMRRDVAANERKRMAFLLDNIDTFAEWHQWRGQQPYPGTFLDHKFPFDFPGANDALPR